MIYELAACADGDVDVFSLAEDDYSAEFGFRREYIIGHFTQVKEQYGEPCEMFFRGNFDTVDNISFDSIEQIRDYILLKKPG